MSVPQSLIQELPEELRLHMLIAYFQLPNGLHSERFPSIKMARVDNLIAAFPEPYICERNDFRIPYPPAHLNKYVRDLEFEFTMVNAQSWCNIAREYNGPRAHDKQMIWFEKLAAGQLGFERLETIRLTFRAKGSLRMFYMDLKALLRTFEAADPLRIRAKNLEVALHGHQNDDSCNADCEGEDMNGNCRYIAMIKDLFQIHQDSLLLDILTHLIRFARASSIMLRSGGKNNALVYFVTQVCYNHIVQQRLFARDEDSGAQSVAAFGLQFVIKHSRRTVQSAVSCLEIASARPSKSILDHIVELPDEIKLYILGEVVQWKNPIRYDRWQTLKIIRIDPLIALHPEISRVVPEAVFKYNPLVLAFKGEKAHIESSNSKSQNGFLRTSPLSIYYPKPHVNYWVRSLELHIPMCRRGDGFRREVEFLRRLGSPQIGFTKLNRFELNFAHPDKWKPNVCAQCLRTTTSTYLNFYPTMETLADFRHELTKQIHPEMSLKIKAITVEVRLPKCEGLCAREKEVPYQVEVAALQDMLIPGGVDRAAIGPEIGDIKEAMEWEMERWTTF
ncbi:hypothetical protein BDV96DRAFT_660686 [Lophiotrema nucula]|uniref:Uncharacterized protein n=1 Tax=Lophiotrema nucula TaxID=690887 RepID=A0A6A5Z4B3_9PLEO|nr:hypothetical protein BDV96DRAFT_660686 [Lophiotrema nucula]